MVGQENKMNAHFYRGWIANAWKKEDADAQIIKLQTIFIGILGMICIGLMIGWMREPSNLTIHIPPDIQNGATIKVGFIPPSLIYSFTYQIWQEVNSWPQSGELDYKKNSQAHWAYFTQRGLNALNDEFDELKSSGQLSRTRFMQGLSGAAYDSANVKILDKNTWEVDLKMHLIEYKNNQPVKDVDIIYPLRVTRINLSPKDNPYGFAIDGFVSEPQRLTTYI
jgi:integrating conjugative element protein (TIGR03746 family)